MQLDDDIIAFLEGGASITVAARSTALIPSVARVKACRVLRGDKIRVRLVLSSAEAGDLLDDIRNTRMISATFSDVTSHHTLQLKARDALIDNLHTADAEAVAQYEQNFGASLQAIGFPRHFTHAFLVAESTDNFTVEFTPTEMFRQTPGPDAGTRMVSE